MIYKALSVCFCFFYIKHCSAPLNVLIHFLAIVVLYQYSGVPPGPSNGSCCASFSLSSLKTGMLCHLMALTDTFLVRPLHSGKTQTNILILTFPSFLHCLCLLQRECLRQTIHSAKVDQSAQIQKGRHLFRSCGYFGPHRFHFGYCRWCGVAGGEQVAHVKLGWYIVWIYGWQICSPPLVDG